MTKFMKMQIIWSSVVFVLILIIGFLGVYALQKSMTIKMSYTVNPNIRCELYIHTIADEQDEYNLMFSNISGEEYIHPDWQLFEDTGTLKYNPNFSGDLGSIFSIKVLNYTPTKLFAEVKGDSASYSSVALDAFSTTPDNLDNVLTISAVSSNYEINFYKIENNYLTATLTGVQFDLENYEDNTLLRCGNNYYLPLGEDLNGKLVAPQNATILFDSISTETYTYSTSTNILTILNANLTNTTLTARGVFYVTFDANGGSVSPTTKEVICDATYGTLPTPTTTQTGVAFQGWNGKNLLPAIEEHIVTPLGTYGISYAGGVITSDPEKSDGNWWRYAADVLSGYNIILNANRTYTLSYWVKREGIGSTGGTGFNQMSLYLGRNYQNQVYNETENFVPTDSWRRFSVTFNGNGSALTNICIYRAQDGKDGVSGPKWYYKDFMLEESPTATPYEPYYISSTTQVVRTTNHTLRAIWA